MKISAFLVAFLGLCPSGFAADPPPPSLADRIAKIDAVAHFRPAKFASDSERAEIIQLWATTEEGLLEYAAAHPNDFNSELLLGEIYRLGFNMDVPGAGRKAEDHFDAAAKLGPTECKPYYLLGRLYMSTEEYQKAELNFLRAWLFCADPEAMNVLGALGYAYYFSGQRQMALSLAARVLTNYPNDPTMKALVEACESKAVPASGPKKGGV